MAIRSGLAAQVGFKEESTYGTAVVVDEFLPLVGESMTLAEAFSESSAIYAGRQVMRSDQWNSGAENVGGSLQFELMNQDMRTLFKSMLGSETGSGPWTYTPGDLFGTSLTVQVGKPGAGGTVHPHTFAGCKVSSWEIACAVDGFATLSLDLVGKSEATSGGGAAALQTAAYTSGLQSYKFTGAAVTVAGSSVNASQLTITGNNGLAERRFLNSQQTAEPVQAELANYSGAITVEFEDLTQYALYRAHTEVAIVATFTNSSSSIVITMNARLDGETPQVGGKGIVAQTLPFTCVASGADSTAISAVITE